MPIDLHWHLIEMIKRRCWRLAAVADRAAHACRREIKLTRPWRPASWEVRCSCWRLVIDWSRTEGRCSEGEKKMKDGCREWELEMRFLYVEKGSWTKRPQFSLDDSAFNAKAVWGLASLSSPNYPDHQIISGKSILRNSLHSSKEGDTYVQRSLFVTTSENSALSCLVSTFSVQLHSDFVTLLLSTAYEKRGWDCQDPNKIGKLDALDNGCCSTISNFICEWLFKSIRNLSSLCSPFLFLRGCKRLSLFYIVEPRVQSRQKYLPPHQGERSFTPWKLSNLNVEKFPGCFEMLIAKKKLEVSMSFEVARFGDTNVLWLLAVSADGHFHQPRYDVENFHKQVELYEGQWISQKMWIFGPVQGFSSTYRSLVLGQYLDFQLLPLPGRRHVPWCWSWSSNYLQTYSRYPIHQIQTYHTDNQLLMSLVVWASLLGYCGG